MEMAVSRGKGYWGIHSQRKIAANCVGRGGLGWGKKELRLLDIENGNVLFLTMGGKPTENGGILEEGGLEAGGVKSDSVCRFVVVGYAGHVCDSEWSRV